MYTTGDDSSRPRPDHGYHPAAARRSAPFKPTNLAEYFNNQMYFRFPQPSQNLLSPTNQTKIIKRRPMR